MDKNDFSMRLTQLRENKGISARDMSLSIGQNPGYINNIESGKSMPSLAGIFYICDFLDITPSEFFDMQNKHPAKIAAVNKDLKLLSEEKLDTIAALIKHLL